MFLFIKHARTHFYVHSISTISLLVTITGSMQFGFPLHLLFLLWSQGVPCYVTCVAPVCLSSTVLLCRLHWFTFGWFLHLDKMYILVNVRFNINASYFARSRLVTWDATNFIDLNYSCKVFDYPFPHQWAAGPQTLKISPSSTAPYSVANVLQLFWLYFKRKLKWKKGNQEKSQKWFYFR